MPLTPQRMAEIQKLVLRLCYMDPPVGGAVADLLAEVHRLRAGIEALAATGEADGRGNSRDLARRLRALLNPEETP